jgi:hypothetical protein
MDLKAVKAYALARAGEASTWRGLILIGTAVGAVNVTPEQQAAIIAIGVGASGFIGAAFPDAGNKPNA